MSRSVWIINKTGWDYDDSHYFKSEGLFPYKAFTDSEIALSFLKDLEASEIRDCASRFFSDFAQIEEFEYTQSETNFKSSCERLHLSHDGHEFSFSKPIEAYSDDELLNIAKAFSVYFFQLVEVELMA